MKLYVILPYSNPCGFLRRKQLFEECLARLLLFRETNPNLEIIVSEMVYGWKQGKTITECNGYTHIILSGVDILWGKENITNHAIMHIMSKIGLTNPPRVIISWVDADVRFMNVNWIKDTVSKFQNSSTGLFLQLFSHAILMTPDDKPDYTVPSFCFQYASHAPYYDHHNRHDSYWHPGFAWAMDSDTMRKIMVETGTALPEHTVGGADRHMALAAAGFTDKPSPYMTPQYLEMINRWRVAYQRTGCRLSVIPGSIQHSYHGTMANRKYVERNVLLDGFIPNVTTRIDEYGIVQWFQASNELRLAVIKYFMDRDEDDIYKILGMPYHRAPSWADQMASRLKMYVKDGLSGQDQQDQQDHDKRDVPIVPNVPSKTDESFVGTVVGVMKDLANAITISRSIISKEQKYANDLDGYC
jgi:hypothetical protein